MFEISLKKYRKLPITFKASFWFLIANVVQRAISMLTIPVFTRVLSVSEYGEFSIFYTWLQILTVITTLRLDFAVFNKGMSKYENKRQEYTASMQGLTSTISLVVFIVYLLFRKNINEFTGLSTFLTLIAFVYLFFYPAISFWTIYQRYELRYKRVVSVTLIMAIVNPVAGLMAVSLAEEKGIARILSFVLVQLIFGLYFYGLNLKSGRIFFSKEYWQFAFWFNLPLIPHYFSTYMLDQSDRVMIERFCGLEMVAIYSVAYNISMVMKVITSSIHNAMIPWLYERLKKEDYGEINNNIRPMLILVGILVVMFMLFAPEAIMVLAGSKYNEAIYIVPPVSISVYYIFVYGIFANIEVFYNKNKFSMYTSVFVALINICLNYIFIPQYGFVVAGYTTMVSYLMFMYAHVFFTNYIARSELKCKIFNMVQLNIYSLVLTIITLIIGISYNFSYARYLLIILIFGGAIIKRDWIMKSINNINEN